MTTTMGIVKKIYVVKKYNIVSGNTGSDQGQEWVCFVVSLLVTSIGVTLNLSALFDNPRSSNSLTYMRLADDNQPCHRGLNGSQCRHLHI